MPNSLKPLLPCPFCGSENIDAQGWASTDSAGPACDDCGASAGGVKGTLQDNITTWNTRANVLHHTSPLRYALDNAARSIKSMRGVMDSYASKIEALRAEARTLVRQNGEWQDRVERLAEALRAERNEKRREWEREMAADGWQVSSHCAHTADSACYCDCGNGGLCEHKWDGEPWQSADGCGCSATCSRCGITAMSHSLRTAP